MKFKFLFIILFLPFLTFSQETYSYNITTFAKNINYKEQLIYKGKIIKITKNNLIRVKTYGKEYLQTTYIHKYKKWDIRFYGYLNLFEIKLTPAISLRYNF